MLDCEVIEGITLLLPVRYKATYHSLDMLIEEKAGLALKVKYVLL